MNWLIIRLVFALVWTSVASAQDFEKNSNDQKHPVLGGIVEVQTIVLDEPTAFMRDGKTTETRDVILIRIRVERLGEFLPRGASPPQFMYGNTVAQMLVNPITSGIAVILAPQSVTGEALPLWLAPPGASAGQMSIESSQHLLKQVESLSPGRVTTLTLPDVVENVRIENVDSLRRFWRQKTSTQEKR